MRFAAIDRDVSNILGYIGYAFQISLMWFLSLPAIPMILIGALVYFFPAMIAVVRGHRNMIAIFVLNLLAGWTFLGWVTAIVWSFVSSRPIEPRRR